MPELRDYTDRRILTWQLQEIGDAVEEVHRCLLHASEIRCDDDSVGAYYAIRRQTFNASLAMCTLRAVLRGVQEQQLPERAS